MFNELFLEVAAVILTASVLAMIAYKLRQPLVVAYLISGMIIGPSVLGFVHLEEFETLSSFGIALLLFVVGLNLNWRNIKDVGAVAIFGGLAQVVVVSLLGFGLAQLLHFNLLTSVFLGVAFSFSSTIIIVKLLADLEDIDRLYGRIAVGILLLQDLLAMILLLVLAAYIDGGSLGEVLTISFGKAALAIGVLWLLARFVVPHLFRYAAHSQELLFLVALSWCFAVASALQLLGFGIEIGALLAGVSLAGTGFQHEIEAKIRTLRDFFVVLFFVVLGASLTLSSSNFIPTLLPAAAFSGLILLVNPIVVGLILRLFGHHPRTGFLTGTTLAQVSEFAFILAASGVSLGLLDQSILAIVTLTALITITVSSYIIAEHERIYDFLQDRLAFLRTAGADSDANFEDVPDVVLLGYDRMGQAILPIISDLFDDFVIVDFNPAVIEDLQHRGIRAVYGDAGSPEVLKFARVDKVKMIISAIPDMTVNEQVMDFVKHAGVKGTVILTVKSSEDAARCYALGATFVIVPTVLGGEHFAQLLKKKKTAKLQWGMLGKKERRQFIAPTP